MKIPLGKGTSQGNKKLFHAKMKVNTCTIHEISLFIEEDDHVGEIGVFAITRMSL